MNPTPEYLAARRRVALYATGAALHASCCAAQLVIAALAVREGWDSLAALCVVFAVLAAVLLVFSWCALDSAWWEMRLTRKYDNPDTQS